MPQAMIAVYQVVYTLRVGPIFQVFCSSMDNGANYCNDAKGIVLLGMWAKQDIIVWPVGADPPAFAEEVLVSKLCPFLTVPVMAR